MFSNLPARIAREAGSRLHELAGDQEDAELYGHPAVAVLDENGVVVARHIGGGDAETWEALAEGL